MSDDRQYRLTMQNGVAEVYIPENLTLDEFDDLREWFFLILRQLERKRLKMTADKKVENSGLSLEEPGARPPDQL